MKHDLLKSKDMDIFFPLFLFFNIGQKTITDYLRKAFRQSARLVFKTVLHHYTVYKIYQTLELKFPFSHWHVDKAVQI